MPKKDNYISLREATKYCDYSQEYLSLRARQGKLKAVKIGRNWVTKKTWLNSYVKTLGSKNNGKGKKNKAKDIIEPPKNLPVLDEGKEVFVSVEEKKPHIEFTYPNIQQRPNLERKFSIPLVRHDPISVEEVAVKKKKDSTLLKIFAILLFFTVTIAGISFVDQKEIKFSFEKGEEAFKETRNILADMASEESRILVRNTFLEYKDWCFDNIKESPADFSRGYLKVGSFIETKVSSGFKFISVSFEKMYKFIFSSESEVLEGNTQNEENQGLVVFPSSEGDLELKEKIKKSFSDDVEITPQDETSGIIVPIFKEKEGGKYFYVMVPLED